jgi:peptide-methionine (S)-S-oxide reductase
MLLDRLKRSFASTEKTTLPGRPERPLELSGVHHVNGRGMFEPFPDGIERVLLGMGCFWGAERLLWNLDGVWVTAVGYAGGTTPNPTYEEVCSGLTGHTEAVLVVYHPKKVAFETVLKTFFEGHNPTQGMRQGNDVGTQYRSAIYYYTEAQRAAAEQARDAFQRALQASGFGPITTEIAPAGEFYYAEEDHQQYLAKKPWGYCGLGGTGVTCPIGTGVAAAE